MILFDAPQVALMVKYFVTLVLAMKCKIQRQTP
jgi:hypothetical protein